MFVCTGKSHLLKEIRRLQKDTDIIIAKIAFQRLVKEVAQDLVPGIRFQSTAVGALQESAKAYIVSLMKMLTCVHATPGVKHYSTTICTSRVAFVVISNS